MEITSAVQYWLRRGGLSALESLQENKDEDTELVFRESIWEAPRESIITVGEPEDKSWERKPIAMSLGTQKAEEVETWLQSAPIDELIDVAQEVDLSY